MPASAISSLISGPGTGSPPSDANSFGDFPGNTGDVTPQDSRPSQLEKEKLFDILKGWFRADSTHLAPWCVEAKEMFDFRAGNQWASEDKQILNAQSRPEITFNRVLTILKAVAGMEINGRHEVHYIPRHNEDTAVNELLTGAAKWMTDECDAEDEESQAFDDCNTCGVSFCLSDDTLVRLPRTLFATSRMYSGQIIHIELENGKHLTGTPNHPVLTDRGWKSLGSLNECDNLICSAFLQGIDGLPVDDFDKIEARLEDRVNAFRRACDTTARASFSTRANDFYGDGTGSKVHVVYADRLLLDKFRDASRAEKREQGSLVVRDFLAGVCALFFRDSMLFHPVGAGKCGAAFGVAHTPYSQAASLHRFAKFVAGISQVACDGFGALTSLFRDFYSGKIFLKVHSHDVGDRHGEGVPASLAAQGISGSLKSVPNQNRVHPEFFANCSDWKPFLEIEARKLSRGDGVAAQSMVGITRRIVKNVSEFRVYDVGTSLGFFIAADVVTSNCEHRLDYELDRKGLYVEERIDPLEMRWDRNAKRKNLVDARRMARVRKVPLADAMQLFRGKTRHELDATWAIGTEMDASQKTLEEKRKREENTTDTDYDDMYEVTIVNMQWWEREVYWLIADPITNKQLELSQKEYQAFTSRMKSMSTAGLDVKFLAVEMTRRVYKEAYLGGEVLSIGDAALGQFKWTAMTGEFDRTRGQWFGLVKIMRDPQMWANKWLSQSLHILNTTAKGGVVAEMDAFEDVRDAEDKWARPDSIIWVKRGALSGDKPKIMPRPGGAFPQGHIQLMEFAISAIRDVTGINLELLGMKDQNQPGILEAQRKQAGMTVLATVFDSLRRFRKLGGRIRLHIIQNYLSDGRLIRVVGRDGAKAIPLMKDKCTGDYDVIIDDAPTSPNQKEANWAVISSMLPAFKDQLTSNPQLMVDCLEFSPLPPKLIDAIKTTIAQGAPQQQQQQSMMQAAATAKINKDQAQAELFLAQGKKQESTAMYDIAISMAEFMNAHNTSDLNAAKAAHEKVKAAVAAMTPIPQPNNSAGDQAHERTMQAADQAHQANQQVGQQRFDMVSQLLKQAHEKELADQQAQQVQQRPQMEPA
jgi:hypothetical protein